MSVRSAFEFLLAETAKLKGCTLVSELSEKSGGSLMRPDGTLRDAANRPDDPEYIVRLIGQVVRVGKPKPQPIKGGSHE